MFMTLKIEIISEALKLIETEIPDTTHVNNMFIFFSSGVFLSAMSKPKPCLCSDTHMPSVLLINIAQTSLEVT